MCQYYVILVLPHTVVKRVAYGVASVVCRQRKIKHAISIKSYQKLIQMHGNTPKE